MKWSLDPKSERLDILVRAATDKGDHETVERLLKDRPEIPTSSMWVWEGFIMLNSFRQSGFSGPNPLVFSEIVAYTQSILGTGLTEELLEDFFFYIRELDRFWLSEWSSRHKAAAQTTKGNNRGR